MPSASPHCGNGIRETGEECDDGNPEPLDFCGGCMLRVPCYTVLPDGGAHQPFDAAPDEDVGIDPCPTPPDAYVEDAGHEVLGVRRGWAGLLECNPDDETTLVNNVRRLELTDVRTIDRTEEL